ncbi:MAG: hypothetical protein Ct9H90mP20_2580 [Candidatus Neomarinimicrobiota bacterium]|nr:MAG: hypothetical protein Ct9H90mP20_2580 [Candidatus Neomarinimicrobiota bacterium]
MVIDGYSLEEITEILNTRIDYRELRENTQGGLFKSMGVMAPAWGMVGTLIGLVVMFLVLVVKVEEQILLAGMSLH